jgi:hypothetical protein
MASLLNIFEPEKSTSHVFVQESSFKPVDNERTTTSFNVSLNRDEPSKNPLINRAESDVVKGAGLIVLRDRKILKYNF